MDKAAPVVSPTEEPAPPNLGELQYQLNEAVLRFQQIDRDFQNEQQLRNQALKAVSDVQKKINAAVAAMKRDAPLKTPWGDEKTKV